MKYLTKEWYDLCQQTDLHLGMSVRKEAVRKDEGFYQLLYKRKEREFIKIQNKVYDVDPRFMLKEDGSVFVPADKFISGEEVSEEDTVVYNMPIEEKNRINKLIEEYDSRPPFDVDKCRMQFQEAQESNLSDITKQLPKELYSQIADPRVFALGYCTREILGQLKKYSKENEKRVHEVLSEYSKAQQEQDIPAKLIEEFGFHDCEVTSFAFDNDVVLCLDTSGGFSEYNKIIFYDAKIIKQEKSLEGSIWLYEELYCTPNGYEAHILLVNDSVHELTISCKNITIDEV